jgi:hypothetical protein
VRQVGAPKKCAEIFRPQNLESLAKSVGALFGNLGAPAFTALFQNDSKKRSKCRCADQKSAHFLGAPKSAPNLPEVNGAPYRLVGAPP